MYDIEFTIREPKVRWLNKILFSALTAGYIALVIYVYKGGNSNKMTPSDKNHAIVYLLMLLLILVVYVLPIIARHYIYLNFTNRKIQHSYSISLFTYNKKWKNLDNLDYISVFHTANGYEVNLWYKKNKILNLFTLDDFDEVLKKVFSFLKNLI